MLRICTKCHELKQLEEFGKDTRALTGYKFQCKMCIQARKLKRKQEVEYDIVNDRDKVIAIHSHMARVSKEIAET